MVVLRAPLAPGVPLQMVAVDDIGAAAAAALLDPASVPGGAIEIAGDELTGEQVAAAFGDRAGLPARFEPLPLDVLADDPDQTPCSRGSRRRRRTGQTSRRPDGSSRSSRTSGPGSAAATEVQADAMAADGERERSGRPLRRDALANQERLLAAATAVFLREGHHVPMATIAAEAGVGVGTLYRRYPAATPCWRH